MAKTYDLPKKLVKQATRESDNELRAQHEKGIFDDGDFNYATGKYVHLFGYSQEELPRKQYE